MDNEAALEEKEVDVISLFAAQGEEDNDEIMENTELPETAEELKALLLQERDIKSKRNKSLRKSKDANHRMQDEMKSLQDQIGELKNSMNKPETEARKREQDEVRAEWRTSVAEDPDKMSDYVAWENAQTQDSVINYIAEMKRDFDSQLADLKGATNPEKMQYQEELNILRTNPDLADFSDEALIKFAKATKAATERIPPGSLGGKRATVSQEEFKVTDELRKKMGFEPTGV